MQVGGIDVTHWNPIRRDGLWRVLRRIGVGPKVNNFGDLLGPMIVERIWSNAGKPQRSVSNDRRVLTVGSIMHFANSGDVVWGSGVNGKVDAALHQFEDLDVRAVRGPRTREFLQNRGIEVPEVFGDPALLVPELFPEFERAVTAKERVTLLVPNLHDRKLLPGREDVLDPTRPVGECIRSILASERVVSSSLHGVVIAEAYGIPALLVKPGLESSFKYADYYEGTGRVEFRMVSSFEESDSWWESWEAPKFNAHSLSSSFPSDMWAEL